MKRDAVYKDERTTAVENASYRWGFIVLSYGILLDITYRGFILKESGWDLMGLVILAGLITTGYQAAKKILNRGWLIWALVTMTIAAVVAIIIGLVR